MDVEILLLVIRVIVFSYFLFIGIDLGLSR